MQLGRQVSVDKTGDPTTTTALFLSSRTTSNGAPNGHRSRWDFRYSDCDDHGYHQADGQWRSFTKKASSAHQWRHCGSLQQRDVQGAGSRKAKSKEVGSPDKSRKQVETAIIAEGCCQVPQAARHDQSGWRSSFKPIFSPGIHGYQSAPTTTLYRARYPRNRNRPESREA